MVTIVTFKHQMTVNIIFSVVFVARLIFNLKIGVKVDIANCWTSKECFVRGWEEGPLKWMHAPSLLQYNLKEKNEVFQSTWSKLLTIYGFLNKLINNEPAALVLSSHLMKEHHAFICKCFVVQRPHDMQFKCKLMDSNIVYILQLIGCQEGRLLCVNWHGYPHVLRVILFGKSCCLLHKLWLILFETNSRSTHMLRLIIPVWNKYATSSATPWSSCRWLVRL